jgi:predicted MFS family arabinose efflux permease
MKPPWVVVVVLGSTQALAWGSSFYLPAVLARPMAPDLGLSPAWIFASLSLGLAISALFGPLAGRLIDQRGGRPVLCASNLLFALGLVLLALATGISSLLLAWLILGIAMAAGLYEPAFAALTRLYGHRSHSPITGITLIAGFASTVGWPLSAFLEHRFGWRTACLGWATLHLCVGLPLNAWVLGHSSDLPTVTHSPARKTREEVVGTDRRILILAFMYTASGIGSYGVAANLPGLFSTLGATPAATIVAASLMGPAQVAARILEFGVRRWSNPLISAKVANAMHPIAAIAVAVGGAPVITLFSVIHGAGNGILTIARGTLPLALFGPVGYGARLGRISAPGRIGQALGPFLFGAALQRFGTHVLIISSALSLMALASMFQITLPRGELGTTSVPR